MTVRKSSTGRYACGCRTEFVHVSRGGMRMIPFCAWHGEGLALRTAALRRLRVLVLGRARVA
jgi:hypothetical protein